MAGEILNYVQWLQEKSGMWVLAFSDSSCIFPFVKILEAPPFLAGIVGDRDGSVPSESCGIWLPLI